MSTFETVSIDQVRRYWDRRPCNIRHSPKPTGTREYFDQVETRKYHVEPHIPGFAEFSRWKGKRVLEIGCGIGTDTINFARHGARVTAVDLSEKSVELARQRARVYGLEDSITFHVANAEELSLSVPRQKYDLVYSFGVIHHTPHPDRALEQIREYGGPGSTLKLMVYHRMSWKAFWIVMKYGHGRFSSARELIARHSEAQTGCPVTYTYSQPEGVDWLRRHGFEMIEARVDHIFPYRVQDYVEYRYRRTLYFRVIPRVLFRAMEKRWGWHLLLTARWPAQARAKAA